MKNQTIFAQVCLLIALSLPGKLLADSTPQLGTQRFTLSSLDTVSREVMVGNVLSELPENFNGEIRIVWTNARYAESVRAIRTALIERGVAPHHIKLSHDVGGYRETGSDGVEVYLTQIFLRVSECEYRSGNYHFDNYADPGCAMNTTRSRALVNPFQYDF